MIDQLKQLLEPFKREITGHPVYSSLKTIEDVRIFMKFHIYAVWDFMSLLKSLQRRFTNVERIWYPKNNAVLTRLINQIVIAEESDVMENGEVLSHYTWYVRAMKQAGSWNEEFSRFYEYSQISPKLDVPQLISDPSVRQFVEKTFQVIDSGKDHEIAAYFLIGRESLIPEMFVEVVEVLGENQSQLELFITYLKRHIEIDGDEHSVLADQMLNEICGKDPEKWDQAFESAREALVGRKILWDGALAARQQSLKLQN